MLDLSSFFFLMIRRPPRSTLSLHDALPICRKSQEAKKSADDQIATLNIAVDRGLPPEALKALEKDEADRNESESMMVLQQFEWSSPELQDQVIKLAQLEAKHAMLDASIPRV